MFQFKDVTEIISLDGGSNASDAAYAIILQDQYQNCPSSLKSQLLTLAADHTKKAKLLVSKIKNVKTSHFSFLSIRVYNLNMCSRTQTNGSPPAKQNCPKQ